MKDCEMNKRLNSETLWTDTISPWITEHFIFLGFKKPRDFMKVRLYDFFNLDCVDNNRAEEMILGLLHFLYPEREERADRSPKKTAALQVIVNVFMPKANEMTIGDLITKEEFSEEEMLNVFDYVTQSFYKSSEYDCRHYKFSNLKDIKRKNKISVQ